MENNNKISLMLDPFIDKIRQQETLLSSKEVKELINNNSLAVKKSKSTNRWRWFGVVIIAVFISTGILILNNKNSVDYKAVETNIPVVSSQQKPVVSSEQKIDQPKPNEEKNSNISLPIAEEKKEKKEVPDPPKPKSESPTPDHVKIYFKGDATITFESNNNKISMIVDGSDDITELRINDETIERENYANYKNIIAEGLRMKEQDEKDKASSSPVEEAQKIATGKLNNAIVNQLREDNLVAGEDHFVFILTGKELFLNDQLQSQGTFEKYKALYEKVSGEKLTPGFRLRISH